MFQGYLFQKNYFRVCPFSMLMFQYYCVKDQWRTFSIKRCPFPLFLPNVSFCCQDEKDINGLLEECRCGGKYQYIIQRTEREREGDRYKGACFYSVYIFSFLKNFQKFSDNQDAPWQKWCDFVTPLVTHSKMLMKESRVDPQNFSTKK